MMAMAVGATAVAFIFLLLGVVLGRELANKRWENAVFFATVRAKTTEELKLLDDLLKDTA